MLAAGVISTAGLGMLLAFASHPARATSADTTTTATTTAPTTVSTPTTATVAPRPDPAPKPAPAPTPAPKTKTKTTPTPTYHPPVITPSAPAVPATHVSSAPAKTPATVTPKKQQAHPSHLRAHTKKNTLGSLVAATRRTTPPAAVTTSAPQVKLSAIVAAPLQPISGGAGGRVVQTALASSTTDGNIGEILLLAGFALGALLITLAMVIPVGATRFTVPEAVIEHYVDLGVLGVALAALTGLVYVLEAAGR